MQIMLGENFFRKKIPLRLQTENTECGLACLSMIAAYYGYDTDVATLRKRFPVSLTGQTLLGVIRTADCLGLSARGLRVGLARLCDVKLPAILHWDLDHFVVLTQVNKNGVVLIDPAKGRRAYDFEEVSRHFTGVALELTPTQEFETGGRRTVVRITDLWERMSGLKSALAMLVGLSVCIQILSITFPLYMKGIVDNAIADNDIGAAVWLACGFGAVLAMSVLGNALRNLALYHVGGSMNMHLSLNLFRHLLSLPSSFFQKRQLSDIISRFGATREVRRILTNTFLPIFVEGVFALSILTVVFLLSPRLTLVMLVPFSLYIIFRMAVSSELIQRNEALIEAQAEEEGHFIESVRSIQSIKLLAGEAQRRSIWHNRHAASYAAGARLQSLMTAVTAARSGFLGFEMIVGIMIAALLVMQEQISIGLFFAFIVYRQQFQDKAYPLIDNFFELRLLNMHIGRLADVITAEPENATGDSSITPTPLAGAVSLRNVMFRYSNQDKVIFDSVNLDIDAGDFVAIIGPSGSGKTTLVKLMLGLVDAVEGEMLYDGVNAERYGYALLRQQIGTVMQDDTLLSGTIATNIAGFDATLDMDKIEASARAAAIHDEIAALPMGYNSSIGDMGSALSGGQRQRIMLARALYRSPRILVLDEGTANLDPERESEVVEVLKKMSDVTRICISHRPATIEAASRIIEVADGAVTERRRARPDAAEAALTRYAT